MLVWNLASCLTLGLAPVLTGAQTINAVTAATFVMAALVTAFGVRETYSRQNAEDLLATERGSTGGTGGGSSSTMQANAGGMLPPPSFGSGIDASESKRLLEVSS